MAKENRKIQNIMLALGLLLLLAGVIWAFLPSDGKIMSFHFVLNCVLVLIMAAFVYFSVLTKKPAVFYIFANFCILSLLSLILSANSVMLQFKQYWPVIVMIFGMTLLPMGRFRYKKFKTIYVIPSVALSVLGAFFLLFTLKIIKVPMREFFSRFMPLILIAGGITLIALYYARLKVKDKIPEIQEDEDDEPLLFTEDY
ncbi:MAG: hypothetical protein IKN82_08745 [Treponema sp.]|nr:hypothetical protein [Treponema sp.]